jgi:hypothetical protein
VCVCVCMCVVRPTPNHTHTPHRHHTTLRSDRTKLSKTQGSIPHTRLSVLSRIALFPHNSTSDPLPKGGLASRCLLAVGLVEWSRDLDNLRAARAGVSGRQRISNVKFQSRTHARECTHTRTRMHHTHPTPDTPQARHAHTPRAPTHTHRTHEQSSFFFLDSKSMFNFDSANLVFESDYNRLLLTPSDYNRLFLVWRV